MAKATATLTLAVLFHVKFLAFFALSAFRVVLALETDVEFSGPGAVRMAAALARDRAIVSNEAKITFADVWMNARALKAALLTDGSTSSTDILISIGTNALKALLEIHACLCRVITVVVSIDALILWWTSQEIPRTSTKLAL